MSNKRMWTVGLAVVIGLAACSGGDSAEAPPESAPVTEPDGGDQRWRALDDAWASTFRPGALEPTLDDGLDTPEEGEAVDDPSVVGEYYPPSEPRETFTPEENPELPESISPSHYG